MTTETHGGAQKRIGRLRNFATLKGDRPSIRAAIGLALSILAALALVLFAYPAGIGIFTDLGECTQTCLDEAHESTRTLGALLLIPFVLVGFLLFWFGSSRAAQRKGAWVVLLGSYAIFFAVVYWGTPSA